MAFIMCLVKKLAVTEPFVTGLFCGAQKPENATDF